MRCLAAATRENAFGCEEAVNVLGACFFAHQDYLLTQLAQLFREVCVEDTLARGCARRGRQPGSYRFRCAFRVETGVQELLEQLRIYAQQRLFLRDQSLAEHIDRRLDRRCGVHLAVARLQAVERAFLDREFVVLHLLVVGLELVAKLHQLRIK